MGKMVFMSVHLLRVSQNTFIDSDVQNLEKIKKSLLKALLSGNKKQASK